MDVAIHIGTSGWHYNHWRGVFYPPGVTKKDYMAFYQRYFSTVEVNNTIAGRTRSAHWRNTRSG
jgi:uncharacterized protein YecE (DUF72 family)